ncbi:MAG: invasion associated locus B family protein [Pseudomonadota bacterium]
MIKSILFSMLCALGISSIAMAQTVSNPVARFDDWSVFEADSPKECFAVTAPRLTVNTRGGREVSVRRSEILLFVFYRPSADTKGQIAFTGGYPFATGRSITLQVDNRSFDLSTNGEWAWPATPEDDAVVAAAMRRGAKATITGQSGRGTVTKDEFSLTGFTAAMADAERRCTG